MSSVAVLDIGKTNVKLNVALRDGTIVETVSTANSSHPGPPYRHHDVSAVEDWFLDRLAAFGRRHAVGAIVACVHGSAGVLVDDSGPVLPMMDYEAELPESVDAAYRALAGPVEERGSPTLLSAHHLARQLFWIETAWPQALARARWFLGGPQYWAWLLSGVAASEVTYLGAQSHLWNIPQRRFTRIVADRGWRRLLPDLRPAWAPLGRLRPELARRLGLAEDIEILCGIHDSSANFYRYQQAGLSDLAVISTGTWIAGMGDRFAPDALGETSGMMWNADVEGRPLTGMLAMGGREFAVIAGDAGEGMADSRLVARLVAAGTMALPSFAGDDGPFGGSAGRGRIVGPPPETPEARRALALLYVALLTDICLDLMGAAGTAVLDGSFVRDPLYPALVAALRPGRPTSFSTDAAGPASGAALLADHARRAAPAAVALATPAPLSIPGLDAYRRRWRDLAGDTRPAARDAPHGAYHGT